MAEEITSACNFIAEHPGDQRLDNVVIYALEVWNKVGSN